MGGLANIAKQYGGMVPDQEKRLRKVVCEVIAEYETEYRFHNEGGHFVERLIKGISEGRGLAASCYLTLTGCSERASGDSIPCAVRKEIEKRITNRLPDQ